MVKSEYNIVFVVLVYRNTADLIEFFLNFKIPDSRVLVVNSYFDSNTDEEFRIIAEKNGADFISVPNMGYGAGNNRGCEYAIKNYNFKYLVISNADIIIKKMDIENMSKYGDSIIAPNIIDLKGVKQNPNIPFKESDIIVNLRYSAYINNRFRIIYFLNALSRLKKIIFYMSYKLRSVPYIYSAHGAFFIMPYKIVCSLMPLFDDDMFMYNEERYLARRFYLKNIKTVYAPEIQIVHKKNGSISLLSEKLFNIHKQSYVELYKKLYKFQCKEK